MIAVSDVLRRTGEILNDQDFVRWTKEELYDWINDGAKEIVIRRPAAGSKTTELTLAAGVIQVAPERTHLIIDVVRNLPTGRRVTLADRRRLEEADPSWYDGKQKDAIKHYTYEDRNPLTFYVYPAAKAGVKLEAVVAFVPVNVTGEGQSVELGEEYIGPLVSYVVYRALLKDSEYANGAVAVAHFTAFSEALGTNTAMSLDSSPTRAKP